MKIALINPVARKTVGYHTTSTKIPPLGLQVLARLTPQQHSIDIIDEIFGLDDTTRLIKKGNYDLVGITAYTSSATRAYELAGFCRAEGITVIMGGPHAWACPDEASEYFDSVVVGECDSIWPEIIEDAHQGQLKKRYEVELCELTSGFGWAKQGLDPINGKYDIACIQTSRGCPVGCDFCSVTQFNGRNIRRRPTDEILAEWNSINKPFIFVVDDNFFGVNSVHAIQAREICHAIIKRGRRKAWSTQSSINVGSKIDDLKLAHRAGCKAILVGIETFNEDTLRQWNKGLNRKHLSDYPKLIGGFHKAGIAVWGGFVIGSDHDTPDSAADTLLAATKLGIDMIQLTNLTPLPGTKVFERMKTSGQIVATEFPLDWERFTFIETVFEPAGMTPRQLDESLFEIRKLARNRAWVWKRSLATFLRTKSISTTIFVHTMNETWRKMAVTVCQRDQKDFTDHKTPVERQKKLAQAF